MSQDKKQALIRLYREPSPEIKIALDVFEAFFRHTPRTGPATP
jgi:hypothetical protein